MEKDQQATIINVSSGKLTKHLLFNGGREFFPITFPNATITGEISACRTAVKLIIMMGTQRGDLDPGAFCREDL